MALSVPGKIKLAKIAGKILEANYSKGSGPSGAKYIADDFKEVYKSIEEMVDE